MKPKPLFMLSVLIITGIALTARPVFARLTANPPAQDLLQHPVFELLDTDGENVLNGSRPVSTMKTCGQCHDTAFITSHSVHVDLGQRGVAPPGQWNPLIYRYALPDDAAGANLSVEKWVEANAARMVGGGPAEAAGLEMDCFVCHLSNPNIAARTEALQQGKFTWANTASLVGTGLVEKSGESYTWIKPAFSEDGKLLPQFAGIQDPANENCAPCHGAVQYSQEPLVLTGCDLSQWQTATTGQVISPARIASSGMNLANKDSLTRSFDIHAERGLKCTDCHYSLNNPTYPQAANSPAFLKLDPRRLSISDYLQKPDHNLARSPNFQNENDAGLTSALQNCESCHDPKAAHAWLPYLDRHLDELACESCHAPRLYAPAVQSGDRTVLIHAEQSLKDVSTTNICRGVEGNGESLSDLVTGFAPVLLPREQMEGGAALAPYNLIATWYWVAGSPPSPISLEDLQTVWFEKGQISPEILSVLDTNKNGLLDENELRLDTTVKQMAVAGRLSKLGLENPHIVGEIRPYRINHNIIGRGWAVKDCKACHSDSSLITQPMKLASYLPGGVAPQFVSDNGAITNGDIYTENGALYYRPATRAQKIYVFGHDRVPWVDWAGALFFIGVLLAVSVHGGLRYFMVLRVSRVKPEYKKVYMYSVYERFWHWLQTFVITLLLFTGLIIHRPDMFGVFSFRYVVVVHNILAALLVINAAFSLFYHLVSGNIRQFLPHPYGFFDEAIVQARYYLQGIFKGREHPFEKIPEKKLNPLQQVTYLGILNVLLPLQIITGAMMWGVQQWPQIESWFGGLPFLAPFHSLVAWIFGAFIVAHVYLATTGPRPLTFIKAMIMGWEDVEIHETAPSKDEKVPSQPISPELKAGPVAE
ncbi:MAG: cytochrome b/b6 domain-containing protein [Anaerolineaceae bacterium]|nr:cytochrome b/b6 domain-containing protein [Anaerolineaceae bacterium]